MTQANHTTPLTPPRPAGGPRAAKRRPAGPWAIVGVALAAVAAIGGVAFWLLKPAPPPEGLPPAPLPVAVQPPATPTPPTPAPPPATAEAASSPPVDVHALLAAAFGDAIVRRLFVLDDFAHRVVATVDALGRARASPALWPLNPTPGRFAVAPRGDGFVVALDNAQRYVRVLNAFEGVGAARLAELARALQGPLQQAYVELGYPHDRFERRLVEVIDLLLATPTPPWPVAVHRPSAPAGAAPSPRPLYEFDDPALQKLTAGQALLVRMGPVNERRVKHLLAEFRARLTTTAPAH